MAPAAGIGASIGGSILPGIGHLLGGAAGAIAAPLLGKAAVNTGGKVLKDVGDAIHT
jgi:hypothetical protein